MEFYSAALSLLNNIHESDTHYIECIGNYYDDVLKAIRGEGVL